MTWMLTNTGRTPDLRYLPACAIAIEDIAQGLAQTNRFTGQASRPYSVAEHSLFVEQLVALISDDPNVRLAALLHDAHEAYFGDMSSPLKQMLNAATGGALRREEARLQGAVLRHFRVTASFHGHTSLIHWADMTALSSEREALMPAHPVVWQVTVDYPAMGEKDFAADAARDWTVWRAAFLARFHDLDDERVARAAAIPRVQPA